MSWSWSETALVVVVLVGLALWLGWVTASRLDRLHRKVVASRHALQAQLDRRGRVSVDLASAGLLDPASAVLLADAALAALDVPDRTADPRPSEAFSLRGLPPERERAESALSMTLRSVLEDPDEVAELRVTEVGDDLLGDLYSAWYRAQLARRFHNEAVAQARRARRPRVVRWLRLAGRAPLPRTVELDDQMPAGLERA
ncbi:MULTISPECIES: hypothetical protein [Isoptericola]|uniref:Uncharacterized protein n=1 Tax=Isoptericola sediminis TaxID=2733572 RepID=A0A849K9J9_9MICO|nr:MULTISPECIES: hypothetical protein [Isoptericola]MDO8145079.1 hypothetical protein [Isoptericola sp. 178]MDO8148713.1 hypothetical protein [Isoptericola sp. b515]MDO8151341.1 hypothetical protein [Isoptericola sp. b408]NNU28689.1 hypothetical protein [Isoptericola sediminis]